MDIAKTRYCKVGNNNIIYSVIEQDKQYRATISFNGNTKNSEFTSHKSAEIWVSRQLKTLMLNDEEE